MNLTGNELVKYAQSKLGTPYFYGSKIADGNLTEKKMQTMHNMYPSTVTIAYMNKARTKGQVGKVNVDCSGLIAGYRGKNLGSSQLYSSAYTRLQVADYKNWANGVVCWRSGHVGIFAKENNNYYVYEAKGIDYGVVRSVFKPTNWTYGLTFNDILYSYQTSLASTAIYKDFNPYQEPTKLVCTTKTANTKGYPTSKFISSGTVGSLDKSNVKWVQWELNEAGCLGFDGKALTIDGNFGTNSEHALKTFQQSAKLTVDKVCGNNTRAAFKVK